jgi:hypothetical protein
MTTKEATAILERLNRWRAGEDIEPPKPREITEAIEKAIEVMKLRTK